RGNAGRVVASILEPLEPLDEKRRGRLRSDVPDDTAHSAQFLCWIRRPNLARHCLRLQLTVPPTRPAALENDERAPSPLLPSELPQSPARSVPCPMDARVPNDPATTTAIRPACLLSRPERPPA